MKKNRLSIKHIAGGKSMLRLSIGEFKIMLLYKKHIKSTQIDVRIKRGFTELNL